MLLTVHQCFLMTLSRKSIVFKPTLRTTNNSLKWFFQRFLIVFFLLVQFNWSQSAVVWVLILPSWAWFCAKQTDYVKRHFEFIMLKLNWLIPILCHIIMKRHVRLRNWQLLWIKEVRRLGLMLLKFLQRNAEWM